MAKCRVNNYLGRYLSCDVRNTQCIVQLNPLFRHTDRNLEGDDTHALATSSNNNSKALVELS
jgi:hypothetical protein